MNRKKSVLAMVLSAAILITALAGCTSNGESVTSKGDADTNSTVPKSEDPVKITMLSGLADYEFQEPTSFQKGVLEKFNVDIEYLQIPPNNFEKIEILFATNSYPEFFPQFWDRQQVQVYQKEKILRSWTNYFDKMPNYKKLFTDEEFSLMKEMTSYNGENYWMPTANFRKASQAWVYKKSLFDEMNLQPPKTTDEMFDVLMKIKKEKIPNLKIVANDTPNEVFNSMLIAFGTTGNVWQDPNNENKLSFSLDDPNYRAAIAYTKKLYQNDLIAVDFPTWTKKQYTTAVSQHETVLRFGWATEFDANNQAETPTEPTANWEMMPFIKSDSNKKAIYLLENPWFGWGAALTDKATDIQQEKVAEMLDYFSTEEGNRWLYFGDEGHSYVIENDYYKFLGDYIDPKLDDKNANITKLQQEGHWINTLKYPDWLVFGMGAEGRGPAKKLSKSSTDILYDNIIMPEFDSLASISPYKMNYTPTEDKKLSTMQITLTDIQERNVLEFIMKNKDPMRDADWNAFVEEMNNNKYQEWKDLYTEIYNRTNN